MPNQQLKLPNVEYEMLVELSQKARKTPIQHLINLIRQQYNGRK